MEEKHYENLFDENRDSPIVKIKTLFLLYFLSKVNMYNTSKLEAKYRQSPHKC